MIEQTDIYISGQDGYHTFRIPALIAAQNGELLAFCEGRRSGSGDSGDIDILLRRSQDGGATWSPIQTVWNDPGNTCGNPCPVVDQHTGTISLLLTHNLGTDVESKIIDGTSEGSRTVWLSHSTNHGENWSTPTNITSTTKQSNWTWYATGPGAGIQLQTGRLVIPCDHIEAVTKKYYSHVIFSDDGGKSWQLGGSTPKDQVNECEVVELPDGRMLLNMRNYDRAQRTRVYSYSEDGGETWSDLSHHPELIEPICQASFRRIEMTKETALLFSNPASKEQRIDMTIRLSTNNGSTWPYAKLLHAGPAAYSCLLATDDNRAYCMYECGTEHAYEVIRLAQFDLDWLCGKTN